MLNNFTVLISIYKKNSLIDIVKLINSIKSQTLYPSEIIIIYDGLVKSEIKLLISKLKNVRIISNIKNLGHGASLKKGVLASKFPVIIRCDADDINLPERFKILYKTFLNNKSLDVIGSFLEEYNNEARFFRNLPTKNSTIKMLLPYRNCINHPTVLLKKKTVLRAGNFEAFSNFEDYYLWLKMSKINANFINIPKIYVKSYVDVKFYKRRGGIHYFKDYKMFMTKSLKFNLINKIQFIINISIRYIIQNLQTKWLRIFYNIILRKKIALNLKM